MSSLLAELATELVRLESLLLAPSFRRDRQAVAALLTDDFREFGSSGRVFDKAAILDLLGSEAPRPASRGSDFKAVAIGPDAVLLTYRSDNSDRQALRSSLWVRRGQSWQLLFHQGTLLPVA